MTKSSKHEASRNLPTKGGGEGTNARGTGQQQSPIQPQGSKVITFRFSSIVIITTTVIILLLVSCFLALSPSPNGTIPDGKQSQTLQNIGRHLDLDLEREIELNLNLDLNPKHGIPKTSQQRMLPWSNARNRQLSTTIELAGLAYKNGDLSGALQLYETCLDLVDSAWFANFGGVLGRDHTRVQESVHVILAMIREVQGGLERHDDALATSERMLRLDLSLYGENDPRTIITFCRLGNSLRLVQPPRTREAIWTFEKIKQHLDQGHMSLNVACIDESLNTEQCAAAIDSIWIHTMFNLADLYHESGIKIEEAKHLFSEIRRRFQRTKVDSEGKKTEERFPDQDKLVAESIASLAAIMLEEEGGRSPLGEVRGWVVNEAKKLCIEAYISMTELHGENQKYAEEPNRCLARAFKNILEECDADDKQDGKKPEGDLCWVRVTL